MVEDSVFAIRKCPTQIKGLDQILQGGLPTGRTTLIIGGPGTGKSLFGLEFLYRSALEGEAGIFVSFEERASALRNNALTLGWELETLEQGDKLYLLDPRIDPKAVVTGEFGLQPFLAILDHKLKAMNAKRVVIDALDVLMRLIIDHSRVQNELRALYHWLEERNLTVLLMMKQPHNDDRSQDYDFMDYLADCVIHLDNRILGQLSTRRLRVIKYRGSGFGSNEYPFVIDRPGITLLPISDVGLSHQALGEKISTGVLAFDGLMYGGYRRASSIMISGSTGTGKTMLCCIFSLAACARGEKVLFVSFEESEAALVSAVLSAGIDLRPAIAAGKLNLLTAIPEAMGAEQHLVRVLAAVERLQPTCIVLESASACKRMGTEQSAFEYLMRLINICKERGILILATNQTAGFMNEEEISGIGISSIIDTIIILRLVTEGGQLNHELLIMKSRGTNHSNRYHGFTISDHGVDINSEQA